MMASLPAALDRAAVLLAWRLDRQLYASSWDSGIGAEQFGGRWNPKGFQAVYCSLDPATCLLELAVHSGFKVLDITPHILTSFEVPDPSKIRVVMPEEIANPAWLGGGTPSSNQQAFGAQLLRDHGFVLFPSAVSKSSWNLVFDPSTVDGRYRILSQERLVVDTRLNPPEP